MSHRYRHLNTAYSPPTRIIGSTYQNTSGLYRLVWGSLSVRCGKTDTKDLYVEARRGAATPTTVVHRAGFPNYQLINMTDEFMFFMLIAPQEYYGLFLVSTTTGSAGVSYWNETTMGN